VFVVVEATAACQDVLSKEGHSDTVFNDGCKLFRFSVPVYCDPCVAECFLRLILLLQFVAVHYL